MDEVGAAPFVAIIIALSAGFMFGWAARRKPVPPAAPKASVARDRYTFTVGDKIRSDHASVRGAITSISRTGGIVFLHVSDHGPLVRLRDAVPDSDLTEHLNEVTQ